MEKQTGLITIAPRWNDFKMKGETALKKVVLNPERDWKKYTSRAERQYVPGFDTLSCTTFSALNDLEIIGNCKIEKKLFSDDNINWLKENGYFDDNGMLNFSDRFIAILSGTTMLGNDVISVGNAIIKYGLIPEKDLPIGGSSWNEYMDPKNISPAMLKKGKEFRSRFLPGYEWVWFSNDATFDQNEVDALQEALLYAPVQIGIPSPSTHATTMIAIQPVTSYDVYDHYEPFFFHTPWNSGGVHWAFRYSLAEVPAPVQPSYPEFEFKRDLEYKSHIKNPELKPDIIMWQKVLIAEGFLKEGLDDGIFLNLTVAGTKQFQEKYGISPVGRVGPVTRKKANELCLKKKSNITVVKKYTPNFTVGRKNNIPEAIVIHVMDGTLIGTDSWFENPFSGVSSHYGIGKTGEIHQYVEESNTAWHAGVVYKPTWKMMKPGLNPNLYTIGIEHEGTANSTWTDALKESSAKLIKDICTRYNIPIDRDHIIGHYEISAKKPNCPAENKSIIEELISLAKML